MPGLGCVREEQCVFSPLSACDPPTLLRLRLMCSRGSHMCPCSLKWRSSAARLSRKEGVATERGVTECGPPGKQHAAVTCPTFRQSAVRDAEQTLSSHPNSLGGMEGQASNMHVLL